MDWWWFLLIAIAIILALFLLKAMTHVIHDLTKKSDTGYARWITGDDDSDKEFHLSYNKMERAENVLA